MRPSEKPFPTTPKPYFQTASKQPENAAGTRANLEAGQNCRLCGCRYGRPSENEVLMKLKPCAGRAAAACFVRQVVFAALSDGLKPKRCGG
ncbi:TPA: hypothetical protein ACFNMI_002412 [Neisseria bacilliformis]